MTYFYRFKKGEQDLTFYKIKLDETGILHVLAALDWRIDYYQKRMKAIEEIKEQLGDSYISSKKDTQQSLDYHIQLRAEIAKQEDKINKLSKASDDIITGIDYEQHRDEQ